MRWRNEAEKKIVLEAAAEYGKRVLQCSLAMRLDTEGEGVLLEQTPEHFEQWLRWWLSEEMHLQSVAAYMRSTAVPIAYETETITIKQHEQRPSLAEKQQTTPKQVPFRLSWPVMMARLKAGELNDEQKHALQEAAAAGGWRLREGETLHHMLSKMNKGALQDKLLDALQEAS